MAVALKPPALVIHLTTYRCEMLHVCSLWLAVIILPFSAAAHLCTARHIAIIVWRGGGVINAIPLPPCAVYPLERGWVRGVCGVGRDIGFLCFSLRWMKQSPRLDFLCCHRSDIDRTTCRQYLLLHSGQLLLWLYLVVSTGVWLISFVAKQRLKTVFYDIKVPIFMFLGKLRVVQNVFDWLHKATEELLLKCWFETACGRPVLLQLCSVSAVRWPPVPGVAYIYLCLSGNNVSLATFSAFTNKY